MKDIFRRVVLLLNLSTLVFVCCVQGNGGSLSEQLDAAIEAEINQSLPAPMPKMRIKQSSEQPIGQKSGQQRKAAPASSFFKQDPFKQFVAQVYNHTRYADVISQDPTHFEALFKLSDQLNLPAGDISQLIRLYYNKLKSCEIIDPSMFERLAVMLPHYTKRFFSVTKKQTIARPSLQRNVENIILSQLTNKFDDFEDNPGLFIKSLSSRLTRLFDLTRGIENGEQNEELSKLRHSIAMLYEVCLGRLLWDIKSPEGVLDSFIRAGQGVLLLEKNNIVQDKALVDDLMWTLVHRFSYYIDLAGGSLPLNFYEHTFDMLQSNAAYFLERDELIKEVRTKKETIIAALEKAKIKAIAFERGLIADDYSLA